MPNLINELLGEVVKFQQINVETVLAAGAYPASGSYIDVSGYSRFGFIVITGTIAHGQTWQVQQATANNGTLKDVTGAVKAVGSTGDNLNYIIEVSTAELDINNGYKFVTLLNTGGSTGDYSAILFFGIGKRVPVTNDSLTALVG